MATAHEYHDHAKCVDNAVETAVALCKQQGLRFTAIRKRVLELVWASHAPMAAYELLKALREEKDNAEAPTVYRALDFLMQHGLVHKIESMNAFIGCDHPGSPHAVQFLICTGCKQVIEQENDDLSHTILKYAILNDFTISSQIIEIMGICSKCQS